MLNSSASREGPLSELMRLKQYLEAKKAQLKEEQVKMKALLPVVQQQDEEIQVSLSFDVFILLCHPQIN